MARTKELNLYRSYRRTIRLKARFSIFHSYLTPVILLLVLGLIAWGVLLRMNLVLMDEVDAAQAWLDDATHEAQYKESLDKQEYRRKLSDDLAELEGLTAGLATYPRPGGPLWEALAQVGDEKVALVITGYDAKAGELLFEARSMEVIDIPHYVLALEETELFHTVEYTGYTFDEGRYVLRLRCTLQADAGREEAAA